MLAACSSSGSTTAAGTSGSGSATPININSVGSFSGPLGANTSRMGEVIKAWASWTNAHGGVDGHPVQLTVIDDAGNAATAITGVKKLITQHNHGYAKPCLKK